MVKLGEVRAKEAEKMLLEAGADPWAEDSETFPAQISLIRWHWPGEPKSRTQEII